MIRELKAALASSAKDNLKLRKKLLKKEAASSTRVPKITPLCGPSLKSEPIAKWVSPIDESITPIRHVIISKKGEVVSQDQLFD